MWEGREVMFDSSICRLCGTTSDRLYNIDNHQLSPSSNCVISLMKRLVPLNIDVKDEKPRQVCAICVNKLEEYNSFVLMCVSTDMTFNNILENLKNAKNITVDANAARKGIIWNEEMKQRSEQQNNVLVIGRSSDGSTDQSQDVYLMLEFNYKGVDIDPLLLKCNKGLSNKVLTPGEVCAKSIDEKLETNACQEPESHEQSKTKDKMKPFKCNICNNMFTRRSNLRAHLALHSDERPHECKSCGKRFATAWDLTVHSHIHSGSFTCDICNKPFVTKSKLERHKKSHAGVKDHPCPMCAKPFADRHNMLAHMTIHSGERPFNCPVCKKSFRTQSHLSDHQKVHSSATPFKCNLCNKSFKWRTNLRDHSKFHTGEKFKCVTCESEFSVRTEFYKHRKQCKGESNLKPCGACIEEIF